MSLGLKLQVLPFSDHIGTRSSRQTFPARGCHTMTKSAFTVRCCLNSSTNLQNSIGRIRDKFAKEKVEITPSAYDTAWVAMVPAREHSGGEPCFPECLDWIIENQNPDGSWGLDPGHPSLVKDSLSCTLACLLALRKWNVGAPQVNKGLEFMRANIWAASDKYEISPIGFNFVFPTMMNYANQLDLTLPFDQDLIDSMIRSRDSQIKSERNVINLGYIAEGLGEAVNWRDILLTHQRSNGSIFNSPAATAAAWIHGQENNKCYEYLQSLLKSFTTWVPTIYPFEVYTRLCLVDTIQRLEIDRYFQSEIDSVLEETYRLWQQKEDDIFGDITCCAVAFRLLRINGFEVSSDELAPYAEQHHISLQMTGVSTILELYRASQLRLYEEETTLGSINDWTTKFLKQQLLSKTILDKKLQKQVEYELKNFNGILGPIAIKRSLDLYDVNNYQIMKAAYRCPTIHNEDFLVISRHEFNINQAQNRKELEELERWYKDCRLDELNYGRDVLHAGNFLGLGTISDHPQMSEARLCTAKSIVLVARLDDFFDQYGSREQSYKLLQLIKEWKEKPTEEYGSKEVEILFRAVFNTGNELAEAASLQQGRCVKHLFISLWGELVTSHIKELDTWIKDAEITMTLDEYLSSFAWMSIACRFCIVTAIHLLGIVRLSEDMVLSSECTNLCIHVSIVVRLLNDLQTFQKEKEERKCNAVGILKDAHEDEEMAVLEIEKVIEYNWRKVLAMVYQRGTILPRKCKDVFLETTKIGYYLYPRGGDEFTSPRVMVEDMRSLIHEPLQVAPIIS